MLRTKMLEPSVAKLQAGSIERKEGVTFPKSWVEISQHTDFIDQQVSYFMEVSVARYASLRT